jgi:hypothetical protein
MYQYVLLVAVIGVLTWALLWLADKRACSRSRVRDPVPGTGSTKGQQNIANRYPDGIP